jgi:hypothetical protein
MTIYVMSDIYIYDINHSHSSIVWSTQDIIPSQQG